jgi:fatty acid desaturase
MVKQSYGSPRHRKSAVRRGLTILFRAILIALGLFLAGVAGWFLGAIIIAANTCCLT